MPPKQNYSAFFKTQPGIDYQVHILMLTALQKAFGNTSQIIHTEVAGYGKFNDLVLSSSENDLILALQIKHTTKESGFVKTDFIVNPNSKAKSPAKDKAMPLCAHFDSVFNFLLKKKQCEKIKFGFVFNVALPIEIRPYVDKKSKTFKDDFWESELYSEIVASIKAHSKVLKEEKNKLAENELSHYKKREKLIDRFLKQLKFYSNHTSLLDIKQQIKNELRTKLGTNNNAIYEAFFHDFYDWVGEKKPRERIGSEVYRYLNNLYAKYIHFERLCGHTEARLKRLASTIRDQTIPRYSSYGRLLESVKTAKNTTVIVEGVPGIGKSHLAMRVISELNLPAGEIIFLDAFLLKDHLNNYRDYLATVPSLKSLFIDDAEQILSDVRFVKQMSGFLVKMAEAKKQIIFLLRSQYIERFQQVLSLAQSEIIHVPRLTLDRVVKVCPDILAKLDETAKNYFIENILSIPFYLKLAIEQSDELQGLMQNFTNNSNNLQCEMIRLAVEKPLPDKSYRQQKADIKNRKQILRTILYSKNNNIVADHLPNFLDQPTTSDTEIDETLEADNLVVLEPDFLPEVVESLVADNILIRQGESIGFSHLLFEEWVLKSIVNSHVKTLIESQSSVYMLFINLENILPSYKKEYGRFLLEHEKFKSYVKKIAAKSYESELPLFNNIFNWALSNHDEDNLKTMLKVLYDLLPLNPHMGRLVFANYNLNDDKILKIISNGNIPLLKNVGCKRYVSYEKQYQAGNHPTVDDGLLALLDRMVHFNETFEWTMDLYCSLVSEDAGLDDGNECHIQNRINKHLFILQGIIGYEQKQAYIQARLNTKNIKYLPLLNALNQVIKFYVGLSVDDSHLLSHVEHEDYSEVVYDYKPGNEDYADFALNHLIQLCNTSRMFGNESQEILYDYVDKCIESSFFSDDFSKINIGKIFEQTDLGLVDDDGCSPFLSQIKRILRLIEIKGEKVVNDPKDFPAFKARIEYFKDIFDRRNPPEQLQAPIVPAFTIFAPGSESDISRQVNFKNLPRR